MIKKLIEKIPETRLLLYLLILGILPLALVGWEFQHQKKALNSKAATIYSICNKGQRLANKQRDNNRVRQHYSSVDPLYVSSQLESLSFLQNERRALEEKLQKTSFPGNDAIHDRHAFLTSPNNQLVFLEGRVESGQGLYETPLSLSHPVEIDAEDMASLLHRIEEGAAQGSPQLIITHFHIEKKRLEDSNEVFKLKKLNLLKREFNNHEKT